jgi:protoheme IX farnesyltransferase
MEVLLFGTALGVAGIAYLALVVHQPLAALVAAITFLSYVFVYTPLKRKTTLNTLIGAVPGALPPVIGWVAVRGSFDLEIGSLFVVLFLWQIPHFLAIAWIYREDYSRAGLRMLPVVDRDGGISARQMVGYCLALLPASLMPLLLGRAGILYLGGAVVLGVSFLGFALAFWHARSPARARGVLRASLVYLPVLLALLLIDALPR